MAEESEEQVEALAKLERDWEERNGDELGSDEAGLVSGSLPVPEAPEKCVFLSTPARGQKVVAFAGCIFPSLPPPQGGALILPPLK